MLVNPIDLKPDFKAFINKRLLVLNQEIYNLTCILTRGREKNILLEETTKQKIKFNHIRIKELLLLKTTIKTEIEKQIKENDDL